MHSQSSGLTEGVSARLDSNGRTRYLQQRGTPTHCDNKGVDMPSLFPGMDPYLEQFWRDIHARCIIYTADQLQAHLPPDLRARVEERVVVEPAFGTTRSIYLDIRVVERGQGRAPIHAVEPAPALAEPLIIYAFDEPTTESFIEIIAVGSGRRVVTVIEVLSLANKLRSDQAVAARSSETCRNTVVYDAFSSHTIPWEPEALSESICAQVAGHIASLSGSVPDKKTRSQEDQSETRGAYISLSAALRAQLAQESMNAERAATSLAKGV